MVRSLQLVEVRPYAEEEEEELMQSRGVRRPTVRPSVNFYTQVATSTSNVTRSPPNLHTMVPTWTCIHGVLKVKVKGQVILALL